MLKIYELFHGAVLIKLVRSDKPVSLRLIETNMNDSWQLYTINDCRIFFKHSASCRKNKSNGLYWGFQFNYRQLKVIQEPKTYLSLICAEKKINKMKNTGICFIDPENVSTLLADGAESISVSYKPKCQYELKSKAVQKPIKIPRNAIDKFNVPP